MAKAPKLKRLRAPRDELTVSHRERLIRELRADPKLAAEYLNAVAEDGDLQAYLVALRTLKAAGLKLAVRRA
jgi:DNA-binding phage protein